MNECQAPPALRGKNFWESDKVNHILSWEELLGEDFCKFTVHGAPLLITFKVAPALERVRQAEYFVAILRPECGAFLSLPNEIDQSCACANTHTHTKQM